MGAFFANIHVQARPGAEAETRALLLSRLRELATVAGLVEAAEGAEATRAVIVGPPGPWIAVYDTATEVEPSTVAALARVLTQATERPALAALVHDSSELFVFLYDAGKKLDELGGKKKGNAARWKGLVPKEKLPTLKETFRREDVFVEDTLRAIGVLLGIDEGGISTGAKYVATDGPMPEGATTLRFRPAEVPEHEKPATGPSRFGARSWSHRTLGGVGESIHVGATVHNAGGASRGVSLIVHGPAVEANLVEPQEAVLSHGEIRSEPRRFERKTLTNGREGYVADFVDYAIPASIARELTKPEGVSPDEWVRKLQQDGVDLLRHHERATASDIRGGFTARAIQAGTAQIYLSFVPNEAREGQFHFGPEVSIIAAPRAPLRATPRQAQSLAPLETPHVLVAFAVSTLERAEAAELAASVIERWSTAWAEGTLTSAVFFDDDGGPPRKPKTSPLEAKTFATGAAWRKLRTAMAKERRVTAHVDFRREAKGPGHRARGDGFEFGTGIGRMTSAGDPDLPTLQLNIDLGGRDDAAALVQMARGVVDEFVVRAKCVQAFVARWGSAGTLEHTLYEGVCGVGGQCTFRRSWQTRFLRAVSADGMWLGPLLFEHIDRGGARSGRAHGTRRRHAPGDAARRRLARRRGARSRADPPERGRLAPRTGLGVRPPRYAARGTAPLNGCRKSAPARPPSHFGVRFRMATDLETRQPPTTYASTNPSCPLLPTVCTAVALTRGSFASASKSCLVPCTRGSALPASTIPPARTTLSITITLPGRVNLSAQAR